MQRDIAILRELAKQYAEVAHKPVQDARRQLWRAHNSLVATRPPVYVREFLARDEIVTPHLACEHSLLRAYEGTLRFWLFHDTLDDDTIVEPWLAVHAVHRLPRDGLWGVQIGRIPSPEPGGAWLFDPPLKRLEDLERLAPAQHAIDEAASTAVLTRIQDAVGDILPVVLDRSPIYDTDLALHLAELRGLEQAMWDMIDHRAWLHRLVGFLAEGVLRVHDQAAAAGDWRLFNGANQAMPYAHELPNPQVGGPAVNRDQLWGFCNAQEFTLVSPRMHEEFMLHYQWPIMQKFGLVAYGCCEDLTHKIDILRRWPNLRRITISPFADIRRCVEQIGRDYVIAWRPNPAEMVCCGFDPARVRSVMRAGVRLLQGTHFDICLKDVNTVEGQPARLREWVKITREVLDD